MKGTSLRTPTGTRHRTRTSPRAALPLGAPWRRKTGRAAPHTQRQPPWRQIARPAPRALRCRSDAARCDRARSRITVPSSSDTAGPGARRHVSGRPRPPAPPGDHHGDAEVLPVVLQGSAGGHPRRVTGPPAASANGANCVTTSPSPRRPRTRRRRGVSRELDWCSAQPWPPVRSCENLAHVFFFFFKINFPEQLLTYDVHPHPGRQQMDGESRAAERAAARSAARRAPREQSRAPNSRR